MLLLNKDVSNFVNTKHILIMRTLPWVSKSLSAPKHVSDMLLMSMCFLLEHIQEHKNFVDHLKTNVIRHSTATEPTLFSHKNSSTYIIIIIIIIITL